MVMVLTVFVITKKVKANIFKHFWFWLMNKRIGEIGLRAKGELILGDLPLYYRTQKYYLVNPIYLLSNDRPLFKIKIVLKEIKEIKLYLPTYMAEFSTVYEKKVKG